MELIEFLEQMNRGVQVGGGSETHEFMHGLADEAMRITMEINRSYHSQAEVVALMSKLTGKQVDESFFLFPPFYTDCGKR